ncbi:MAG: glycosyltransferase family 4 protein [Gemmatimonadales bacterium]
MRIGFDALRALRNRTGLGNYSRRVLRALHDARRPLELYLFTSRPPFAEFSSVADELGARVIMPRRLGALAPSLWRTFRAGCCAASYGVDVYHGLSHEIPRDLPKTRVPSVVTFHDLIFEQYPEYFPPIDRRSYRWRYRWSALHTDAIVAVSRRTRDDLIECYGVDPGRINVIPPPVDPAFSVTTSDATRAQARQEYQFPAEYLLAVGTLEPRKNHTVLVAAMAQIARPERIPLVLVGSDGGGGASLRRTIEAAGLASEILIRENVATADLPALMQGAAVLLYPSVIEGFGMPIAEALSAGVPVVAASGGHLDDAGGPGTAYVPPHDPAAWAAAITALLSDTNRRVLMRSEGREYARRFDGTVVAAQLLAMYDALAGAR